MTQEQAVKAIRNHGHTAWMLPNGKVAAVEVFTVQGEVFDKVVQIEPTRQAVFNWLGY